jgi:hypothetical protein
MPQVPPATARDRFVLVLEGVVCGLVTSAEGGDISAPVIREAGGAFVRKHLGDPVTEPIHLSVELSLQKTVYDWIAATWQGKGEAKSGSLIELDVNNQATSELAFEKAVIASTSVPAVDASSRAQARLSVSLDPASTTHGPASGPVAGLAVKAKKPWLQANFRLQIDGLDTTRVSKVDTLTVTAGEAGGTDFPDLSVVLAETSADSWLQWHEDFVVKGKNDSFNERSGSLEFLAPDLKAKLGTVRFSGLGIHRLTREQQPDGAPAQVARMAAQLYCQRMELAV